MMTTVETGKKIPAFSLPATSNRTISEQDLLGKQTIIYFYPKDSTSGCTRESQGFRDASAELDALDTQVFGVSRDSLKSHERFKEKESMPFELIADVDETLCKIFDVIRMKNMYGRQVRGIERSTFLIDSDGVLRQEWRKVRVDGHVEKVVEAAKALAAGEQP